MRAIGLSIPFVLCLLILVACARGTPTPAPAPTDPRVGSPRPSPSALVPTTVKPDPGPILATVDSTTTIADEIAPGWVQYEGINEILDLAFAPDGGLWVGTRGGAGALGSGHRHLHALPAPLIPAGTCA